MYKEFTLTTSKKVASQIEDLFASGTEVKRSIHLDKIAINESVTGEFAMVTFKGNPDMIQPEDIFWIGWKAKELEVEQNQEHSQEQAAY